MPGYRGADGATLHYEVRGRPDGPTLVVLAGGAGAHPDYLGTLAGLDDSYRLVVPHLRGVGRSADAPLGELGSRWAQADDLVALREQLGLDRLVLVGHSAGTRLAIAVAALHPDQVGALVLITPPTEYLLGEPGGSPEVAEQRQAEPEFAAATAAFTAGPDPSSDATFNEWQRAIAPRGYARWDRTNREHAATMWFSLAAARDYFIGDGPEDLLVRLARVEVPVLVVAGSADVGVSVPAATAVSGLFADGQCAVVADSGHFPWVEQPAAFRSAVDAFLARVTTTR